MELVLVVVVVALVSGGLLGAVLLTERRRRLAERADELAAQRVEREFRRAFGDDVPRPEPYPRDRTRTTDAQRPGKRSNWEAGKVRPQG